MKKVTWINQLLVISLTMSILLSRFVLTIQKWFVNFSNENKHKTEHKMPSTGWATNKMFYFRYPKMALLEHFFHFFLPICLTDKHQIYILYQETFIKKYCINKKRIVENCLKCHLKILLIKLCEILHACRKESSLLL